jgi:hypothetical protein
MNAALTVNLNDPRARDALGRLHADVGAHVSAQLSWLDARQEAYTQWRPWVLALPGRRGELRAVAALAERRHGGIAQVRCLGHTGLDCARYKLQSATTVIPHEVLMAWSSPRIRWALGRRPVSALPNLVPA